MMKNSTLEAGPTRAIATVLLVAAILAGMLASPAAAARGEKKGRTADTETEEPVLDDSADGSETPTNDEKSNTSKKSKKDSDGTAPEDSTATTTTTSPLTTTAIAESTLEADAIESVTVEEAAMAIYDPDTALGSMYNVVDQINARGLWQQGFTGAGIDVAVIDTGVSAVAALLGPDKVVAMVDLSFEAGVPEAQYLDTNGHGTHMTGIIAGIDPDADPTTADERPDEFVGVAPGAGIVSVKVGDNTGAVDVSQVIAGIDWVVQHRNDGDLNIRVINLSYGTDGEQDYRVDPLARAVENAWEHGIVVVAASGNDGWFTSGGGLTNPAFDPYVIAVGAAEATDSGMRVPQWASSGDYYSLDTDGTRVYWFQEGFTGRVPDVIAPGSHIDSLRVPSSRVDVEHPEGFVSETIFRGSGTSQAAAVVSGAVALLLDARPELTPDQVKALLTGTASPIPYVTIARQGHGVLDIGAAAVAPTPDSIQTWERSTGLGSLEAARGTQHVILDGVTLEGEMTAFGTKWDPEAWVEVSTLGASWTGASWTGASWTGASWTGASWTGASWTGASWTGASWTGASWTGASWTGASWTGASWTGASWTGASWTGASWTGASWTGAGWD